MIRSLETRQIEASGESIEEIQAQLAEATPDGFALVKAPVRMTAGGGVIEATGHYERRDATREIEAADTAGLEAATPEGWRILYVLSV